MKTKEIIQLAAAILIFAAAGFLIYSQLGGKKPAADSDKGSEIVKVTAINPEFNQDALKQLSDPAKAKDFYSAPDLKSGLGNTQPFGPLR